MSDKLFKENLIFFQKSVRYFIEIVLSVQNIPYELGINKNIPTVKNVNQTISQILTGKSIVRFGDGEFRLINGFSIPFQTYNSQLKNKLETILKENNDNLLIGLPETFNNLQQLTFSERIFWRKYMSKNRHLIYQKINLKKTYYSAFFSRPYLRYKNKQNIQNIFKKIQKIWDKKNILIIEGDGTRIGVGNDLLKNTKNIKRIICPNINAFDKYNLISKEALKYKDKLILIALGPTAKILTFELFKKDYQVIDIGHLDIEYEWFLKNTKKRIPIKNKNVLEANSYNTQKCEDKKYLKQIIITLK